MKKLVIPAILAANIAAMFINTDSTKAEEIEEITIVEELEEEVSKKKEVSEKEAEFIGAKAAIVYDEKQDKVIFEKGDDLIIPTASLAKVMTLYIVLDKIEKGEISLSDEVVVSERAWRSAGSRMFLNVGAKITVEDLIRGVAIVSGNDGATALAEHVSGDVETFVKLMNGEAKKLGMNNTMFLTPSGFGNDVGYDTSTVEDLLKLSKSYVKRFDKYMKYHQELEFTTTQEQNGGRNDIVQQATNGLLKSYEGALGLKTGWVADSYNLIGVAERQGVKIITVVLAAKGLTERKSETEKLFDLGYSKYRVYKISEKGEKLETLPVYKAGDFNKVDIVIKNDVKVTLHEDEKGKGDITETIDLPGYILGGVKKGDIIGTKKIMLDGKEIAVVNYTVAEDVPDGGMLNKIKDTAYLSYLWLKDKF